MNISLSRNGHHPVSLEDCYLLTRQLHVLQKAGVPLLSGIQALQTQLPSGALQQVLRDVHQGIMEGRTFSQALGRHPKVFGPVFVSMIRIGEAGGLLSEILEQLTHLYEWEIDLRQRLTAALQYPIIVLCTLSAASAMKAEPIFPPIVVQMVATGEETGRIDELLRSVSEYYDQQVTYTVKRLITYIEPALLLVVGLGVLLMATAVFVPMWDLVKIFKTTGR